MASRSSEASAANPLYLLAINLTERCNLACAHCYMDARVLRDGAPNEIESGEVRALLDEIAARSQETMVVLTGGEPLLRSDLEALVTHGAALGLAMVVGSNGLGLSAKRVAALKAAGAMGVGISLDSLDPEQHDAFRGVPGAWQKTLDGIEACKREGLPFQIHFSVTEANAAELPAMIDFARAVGARVLNVFFLVCTGRGEEMSDISPKTYERVLEEIVRAQEQSLDLLIRARCAPHFKRVAYQRDAASPLTRAAGYEGGGCLAGIHYARVSPTGEVTACPYIPLSEGNIRERAFWDIWDGSERFQVLRRPRLEGKCGACEYRLLCGGCRARPLAKGEGLMAADSWCDYQPQGAATIEPLRESTGRIRWTPEAEIRLARVPSFLRKMVKNRAENHVRELGEDEVNAEHLATLAAKRFGDAGPPRPGAGGHGEGNPQKMNAALPVPPPPHLPPEGRGEIPASLGDLQSNDAAPAQPVSEANAGLPASGLPWSEEARSRLTALPSFLQEGVRVIAEELANAEGRLEVNVKLFERILAEPAEERVKEWTPEARERIAAFLAAKPAAVRMFVSTALEAAAEEQARKRRGSAVEAADAQAAIDRLSGGVEWDPEALARVMAAPDFIRAGIKKAAEFGARREGLARIQAADLTRFRNRAMLRAVQRMKSFGMTELSFDAYQIAKQRVPRLQGNAEADKRFAAIRDYVVKRPDPGDTLGAELIEQMRSELAANTKRKIERSESSSVVGPDETI